VPSLVAAKKGGYVEIFDRSVNAGTDASFWRSKHQELPPGATQSLLAVPTPL